MRRPNSDCSRSPARQIFFRDGAERLAHAYRRRAQAVAARIKA
jgi:hypothetical protein